MTTEKTFRFHATGDIDDAVPDCTVAVTRLEITATNETEQTLKDMTLFDEWGEGNPRLPGWIGVKVIVAKSVSVMCTVTPSTPPSEEVEEPYESEWADTRARSSKEEHDMSPNAWDRGASGSSSDPG